MITKYNCPTCKKPIEVIEEKPIGKDFLLRKLSCKHWTTLKISEIVKAAQSINTDSSIAPKEKFFSLSGKRIDEENYKYQWEGINFARSSNLNCLIADEPGLGKTAQAILSLTPESFPCIVVCPTIVKQNWFREFADWILWKPIFVNGSIKRLRVQVIRTSKDTWFEDFDIHICSYDMIRMHLSNTDKNKVKNYYGEEYKIGSAKEKIREDVDNVFNRVQTVIIDECHYLTNDTSQRTVALKTLCLKVPHKIALSGTYVRNNASEAFPILNILHPERFSNRARFIQTYVDNYFTGYAYKCAGLKDPEFFKEKTKDFIIRREMADVLPDLPEVRRNYNFVELEGEGQKLYDKYWKEFVQFFDENEGEKKDFDYFNSILQKINVLRQICGIAKVPAEVEYAEEFLTGTDRKLIFFIHHHKTGDLLEEKISQLIELLNKDMGMHIGPVLRLKAETNDKDALILEFQNNSSRILIASTQATGVGVNMQFCSDIRLVERQWNPDKEEQVLGRIRRIGQRNGMVFSYSLVAGGIDDYLTEIVEQKRQWTTETMRGEKSLHDWDEQGIILELASTLANKGREKFRL